MLQHIFIILITLRTVAVVWCSGEVAAVMGGVVGSRPLLVGRTLAALNATVGYLETNYLHVNFDGIFGAKIIEGQLTLLAAKFNKGFLSDILDKDMTRDITKMAVRAGHIVKHAVPHLNLKQPTQMKQLRHLLQLSWDVGHSHRSTDPSLLWSNHTRTLVRDHPFNEEQSDACMAELLEPVKGVMCLLSEGCQHTMTRPGRDGYSLTHQVLYTVLAEMSGCGSRLEQWLVKQGRSGSVEQLQAELCSNLQAELNSLAPAALTQGLTQARDLLLEMEFACGMLGYVEFLRRDWLQDILGWQDSSGCFCAASPMPTRALLEEKRLPDGCLSHLTAVGAAALAVHLHYLLYPDVMRPGRLRSEDLVVGPPPLVLVAPKESVPLSSEHQYPIGWYKKIKLRGYLPSGLNRLAEQEKSLEDKADQLLEQWAENNSSSSSSTTLQARNQPILAGPSNLVRPVSQQLSEPEPNHETGPEPAAFVRLGKGSVGQGSLAPLYLLGSSIVLVVVVMGRDLLARRRPHTFFRTRLRL